MFDFRMRNSRDYTLFSTNLQRTRIKDFQITKEIDPSGGMGELPNDFSDGEGFTLFLKSISF